MRTGPRGSAVVRPRPWPLLVAALAVAAGSPAPTYRELVERYLSGEWQAALQEAKQRPIESLDRDVKQFRSWLDRELGADPERRFRLVKAAALLHAELAQENATDRGPAFNRQVAAGVAVLLEADALPLGREQEQFVRALYITLGWLAQSRLDLATGRAVLDRGLRRFPNDPPLLVARASLDEARLTLYAPGQTFPPGSSCTLQEPPRGSCRELLLAIEAQYSRALAARADYTEARLRLGRVLALQGRGAEALPLLEQVAAVAADRRTRYLARLFLGQALETQGQPRAAAIEYAKAAAIAPQAQTAWVAMGHALDEAGDPEGARQVLGRALAAPRQLVDTQRDAWWRYPFGQSEIALRLLPALRAEVAR
jgi:tetratricopeptide (TPR) repeat protein